MANLETDNRCPDKLEPLSDSDMLLFIKLTLQDVLCETIADPSIPDDLIDLDAVQRALQYTENLKEKQ